MDVFAPEAVLEERIERRSREGHDASDANVDIMKLQQESEESFTEEERTHVISVDSTDPESILLAIRELREKTGV